VVEESNAPQSNAEGPPGHLLFPGQVEQVAAHVRLREPVRRTMVMAGQLGHGVHVAIDGARSIAPQLHLFDHLTA